MNLFVFEGPQSRRLRGWRHFLVLDVDSWRKVTWLSTSEGAQRRAERNGWKFFPSGSWESGCRCAELGLDDHAEACPARLTLAEIHPDIQAKLKESCDEGALGV